MGLREDEKKKSGYPVGGQWLDCAAHHCGDVDRPDEVALWPPRHVALENVGLCVHGGYFGAIILEGHLLHGSVLPVGRNKQTKTT